MDRQYFLLAVNDLFQGEVMNDWKALFDWLQHCGLGVEGIYKAVSEYQKSQALLETKFEPQMELPLETW